ncbi:MAG TPA: hypothetical protein VFQ39_06355 [Longimicrobium sp.]|nr:hypothetical protein [Longimicrobium sp.]
MKIRSFALAAALLAAPVPMLAQTQQPAPRAERQHREHGDRMRGEGRQMRSPLQGLIERRQQLNLTDDQVRRLTAVQQRLETENRPLLDQLRGLRGPDGARPRERGELTQEQRQQLRAQREQIRERARPVAEKLRANRESAMREVQSILTDAQKQQLRQFRQEHGRKGREGREGREGRRGREGRNGRQHGEAPRQNQERGS